MTHIDRYIAREFIRLFLFTLMAFILLFLIVDFFEKIRMFIENSANAYQIIFFFFFEIPMIITQTIPAAVLLSALITTGMMSKNGEVVAMKANGLSLYRIALPMLYVSVLICLCSFLFNEIITPYTNEKAEYIRLVEVQKHQSLGTFKQDQLWYKGKEAIYSIRLFDPVQNTLQGITIYYLDSSFRLRERIDAEKAQWENGGWYFQNVLNTTFPPGDFPIMKHMASKLINIEQKPDDFKVVQKEADNMNFMELRKYIQKLETEGFDALRYRIGLYAKVSFPLVSIILTIIGMSFSLRSERSGGFMQSIGAGLVIGFTYWIVHAFFMSFGNSGTFPPILAAWMANILFSLAALFFFLRVRT
ncbi:MAG: LPS export ABC transporter permease LptG [Syntrophales bacterium]|jgi:lipopolysaccharide export system permease protein